IQVPFRHWIFLLGYFLYDRALEQINSKIALTAGFTAAATDSIFTLDVAIAGFCSLINNGGLTAVIVGATTATLRLQWLSCDHEKFSVFPKIYSATQPHQRRSAPASDLRSSMVSAGLRWAPKRSSLQ
uniref:Uncharacterized protein n=1 Tax=Romanomermis culicivorax TaxID=13658 RepID=A0A915HEJ7_ROMCU